VSQPLLLFLLLLLLLRPCCCGCSFGAVTQTIITSNLPICTWVRRSAPPSGALPPPRAVQRNVTLLVAAVADSSACC